MQRDQIIAQKVQARTARPSINMTGLAHQLGISRQALRRRLDHGGWKYDELELLAKALDMTVEELVSDSEKDPNPWPLPGDAVQVDVDLSGGSVDIDSWKKA